MTSPLEPGSQPSTPRRSSWPPATTPTRGAVR